MSSATHGTWLDWGRMLDTWRELDVPEGWRPELTTEGITMVPPPGGPHNLISGTVNRALITALPEGCDVFQTLGVGVEVSAAIFIPDFVVAARDDLPADATPIDAEKVLLVAEITSAGNARTDRHRKKWAYAHGCIPLYLLIDAHAEEGPSVSLYSDPRDGAYRHTITVPFGEQIIIPAPFDLTLQTADF